MNTPTDCSVAIDFDYYGGLAIAIISLVLTIIWVVVAYRKGLI